MRARSIALFVGVLVSAGKELEVLRRVALLVLALVTTVSLRAAAQDATGTRAEYTEVSFRQIWADGLREGHYQVRGIVLELDGAVRCPPCPPEAVCGPCPPPAHLHLAPGSAPRQRDSAVTVLIGSSQDSAMRRLKVGRSYLLAVGVAPPSFRPLPRRRGFPEVYRDVWLEGYTPLPLRTRRASPKRRGAVPS